MNNTTNEQFPLQESSIYDCKLAFFYDVKREFTKRDHKPIQKHVSYRLVQPVLDYVLGRTDDEAHSRLDVTLQNRAANYGVLVNNELWRRTNATMQLHKLADAESLCESVNCGIPFNWDALGGNTSNNITYYTTPATKHDYDLVSNGACNQLTRNQLTWYQKLLDWVFGQKNDR